ncbi:DUF4192 domain-containing protein [Paenarthrobacter sp. NPDC089989]|uniref:DUF4192 domain-containing protein n=1 Tax=unclassified Paenarthrobacter TaxID=2634190 RepID=UPI0037FEFAD7
MTSNETLNIYRPEDVLGYIPHLLGYWPQDSLVAITMQEKTFGATLRVDLPTSNSPRVRAAFAEYVRNHLLADEHADGVVLALYDSAGWDDGSVVCHAMPVLVALQQALETVGLCVREAWLVGDDYWRSAFCTDADCCPVPGLPVDQIRNSRINAEMVYRGSSVGSSPQSRVDPPRLALPGKAPEGVLEAELKFEGQFTGAWRSRLCLDAVMDAWLQILDRPWARGESSLDGAGEVQGFEGPAADEVVGFLRASLAVPPWRDAIMVMAAAGVRSAKAGAEAFSIFDDDVSPSLPFDPRELGLRAGHDPCGWPGTAFGTGGRGRVAGESEVPQPSLDSGHGGLFSYGEVLLGVQPGIPDWPLLDALQRVLSFLSFDEEESEAAAAALTLQGWIAWCKGSGSFAHACLDRALAAQPGYRLAELLDEILGQGTVSGWARRPDSAWGTYVAGRK